MRAGGDALAGAEEARGGFAVDPGEAQAGFEGGEHAIDGNGLAGGDAEVLAGLELFGGSSERVPSDA